MASWNVKILSSKDNNGGRIYVGVAPADIKSGSGLFNGNKCGWYFGCYSSTLCSGPPHNVKLKTYGPRKVGFGEYVRQLDSVGVTMDTTKGELSFTVDGADMGVAFDGIPLDKPLVPCVILFFKGDAVELGPASRAQSSVVSASLSAPPKRTGDKRLQQRHNTQLGPCCKCSVLSGRGGWEQVLGKLL